MRTLGALLEEKCQFQEGEVDLVLLQHTFEVERADGKMETMTSTLEAYGDRNGGPSAMVSRRTRAAPCLMSRDDRPSSLAFPVEWQYSSFSKVYLPSQGFMLHTTRR